MSKDLEEESGSCPFIGECSESGYGDEEICRNDYEYCKTYRAFKESGMVTGDIVIEELPYGICQGSIETYPDKYINHWGMSVIGEGKRDKK